MLESGHDDFSDLIQSLDRFRVFLLSDIDILIQELDTIIYGKLTQDNIERTRKIREKMDNKIRLLKKLDSLKVKLKKSILQG